MSIETRRCVYCLKDKIFAQGKEKAQSEFNREHVIHQAFGTMGTETPTLIGRVCRDCNSLFGRTIDIGLTKDSFEAYMRVQHGLKDASSMDGESSRRLAVKYKEADGTTRRLAVQPSSPGSGSPLGAKAELKLKILNQDKYEYLHSEQLDSISREELLAKYDFSAGRVEAVGVGTDAHELQAKFIEKLGVTGQLQNPILISDAVHEITIDEVLQRAMAKISFNYLVYICEELCPELPYCDFFDESRNFILHGTEPGNYRVANQWEWRDLDPQPKEFAHIGHLVTLEYGKDEFENIVVVGKLSLFREYAQMITLSRCYTGKFCRFDGGHFCDIGNGAFVKLSDETMDRLRGMKLQ